MKEIKRTKEFEGFTELPISKLSRKLINDMEKGRKKEIEVGKKEVALELIKEGSSTDFIVKVTHLDKGEIERLKNKHIE